MELHEIEAALIQTFDDFRLSKPEKIALREIFEDLKSEPEMLRFARNRSFDIVAEQIRSAPDFHMEAIKWLEQVVKTIDSARGDAEHVETSVYFSPGKSCVNKIVSLINNARHAIDVCVFTISDDRISDALQGAKEHGTQVRIITDDDKAYDRGSDVQRLAKQGIPVKTDSSPSHMHHKFALFDGKTLVNGSFNWTRSASTQNQENIVVTDDSHTCTPFKEAFERLWKSCNPI